MTIQILIQISNIKLINMYHISFFFIILKVMESCILICVLLFIIVEKNEKI